MANCDSEETAAEIVAMRERLVRSLNVLRVVEWGGKSTGGRPTCPECGWYGVDEYGGGTAHDAECELAACLTESA